jgi:hypothetical protein
MRFLLFAALLALPLAASAQTAPPQFTVPAPVLQHVVTYLQAGGAYAEGGRATDRSGPAADGDAEARRTE